MSDEDVAGAVGAAHDAMVITEDDIRQLTEVDAERAARVDAETRAVAIADAQAEVERLTRKVEKETGYLAQAQAALDAAKANLAALQGA